MADQDNGTTIDTQPVNGEDTAPAAGLISQYVKDLSFENPNAPAIFQNPNPPAIDVQFNIGTAQVGEEVHEVLLKIDVKAEAEGQTAFIVDLTYAGLFGLRNVPADAIQPFLLGEAPRLLFPFARRARCSARTFGNVPSRPNIATYRAAALVPPFGSASSSCTIATGSAVYADARRAAACRSPPMTSQCSSSA